MPGSPRTPTRAEQGHLPGGKCRESAAPPDGTQGRSTKRGRCGPPGVYPPAMNKSVIFGVLGGLAWFVVGILVGHYVWS